MELAKPQALAPGTRMEFRNGADKPVLLTVSTEHGTRIEVTLSLGASIAVVSGRENINVDFQPQETFTGLRPVP